MPHLDLSNEERELLSDLLTSTIKDLGYEISNTDDYDFRSDLKKRRDALNKLKGDIDSARE